MDNLVEKLREGIPHRNLVTGMTMCSAEVLEAAAKEIERLRTAVEPHDPDRTPHLTVFPRDILDGPWRSSYPPTPIPGERE